MPTQTSNISREYKVCWQICAWIGHKWKYTNTSICPHTLIHFFKYIYGRNVETQSSSFFMTLFVKICHWYPRTQKPNKKYEMKNSYLKSSSLGEQSSVGLGGFTLKLKMILLWMKILLETG